MFGNGEAEKEAIRPDFNQSIFIDFAGAKVTSDAGFLLMREVDQRFGIIESGCSRLVMGHHEAGEGRGQDRLSRKTVAGAYCDSFSLGTPL